MLFTKIIGYLIAAGFFISESVRDSLITCYNFYLFMTWQRLMRRVNFTVAQFLQILENISADSWANLFTTFQYNTIYLIWVMSVIIIKLYYNIFILHHLSRLWQTLRVLLVVAMYWVILMLTRYNSYISRCYI